MKQVEIVWFDIKSDEFDVSQVLTVAKEGFLHKLGEFEYEYDSSVYQFISKEELEIDFKKPLGEFYSNEELMTHELAGNWDYNPEESLGDCIIATTGAFYDKKIDLPLLGITLVWNDGEE